MSGITPEELKRRAQAWRKDFTIRASEAREGFDGGSVRGSQEGKPRFDLIPPEPLRRVAEHYRKGGEHYGNHNWTLGQPTSRMWASLERHVQAYKAGDRVEDHLAAVVFNALGIMHFEGSDWDDLFDWSVAERPPLDLDEAISKLPPPNRATDERYLVEEGYVEGDLVRRARRPEFNPHSWDVV